MDVPYLSSFARHLTGDARTQPAGHVHGQDYPPVPGPWHWHRRQSRPQPVDIDTTMVQCRIQRAMTPPVLTGQGQLHRRPHHRVPAQQRVYQLEQRIRPRGQTPVELMPEPGQPPDRVGRSAIMHTDHQTALDVDLLP